MSCRYKVKDDNSQDDSNWKNIGIEQKEIQQNLNFFFFHVNQETQIAEKYRFTAV